MFYFNIQCTRFYRCNRGGAKSKYNLLLSRARPAWMTAIFCFAHCIFCQQVNHFVWKRGEISIGVIIALHVPRALKLPVCLGLDQHVSIPQCNHCESCSFGMFSTWQCNAGTFDKDISYPGINVWIQNSGANNCSCWVIWETFFGIHVFPNLLIRFCA